MKEKNKIFVIGVVILFLGLIFLSCVNVENCFIAKANVTKSLPSKDRQNNDSQTPITKRYMIFGFGTVKGLYVNSELIDMRRFIKANIEIINEGGFPADSYCLFILNLENGNIFTKRTLHTYFYLSNFTGYLSVRSYYVPHGPYGSGYRIFGFAEDYHRSSLNSFYYSYYRNNENLYSINNKDIYVLEKIKHMGR